MNKNRTGSSSKSVRFEDDDIDLDSLLDEINYDQEDLSVKEPRKSPPVGGVKVLPKFESIGIEHDDDLVQEDLDIPEETIIRVKTPPNRYVEEDVRTVRRTAPETYVEEDVKTTRRTPSKTYVQEEVTTVRRTAPETYIEDDDEVEIQTIRRSPSQTQIKDKVILDSTRISPPGTPVSLPGIVEEEEVKITRRSPSETYVE